MIFYWRKVSFFKNQPFNRRWTPKTAEGAKLYVRLLIGGTDDGKNQKKV